MKAVCVCGGLLVFAQIISNIKKRRNLLKTWISAFLCLEKSCISFFTKPRGNARFFVESCRVLIGFQTGFKRFLKSVHGTAEPFDAADDGDVGIVGCEVNFKRGVMGGGGCD